MNTIAISQRFCPFCGQVHNVEVVREKQRHPLGETYLSFLGTYLRCPVRRECWSDEDISRRNIAAMRIAYREQNEKM